jgi:hypothetical protein
MTMRPLFSAQCGDCSASFGYPSLGDFSYGSSIFSSDDGQCFVYVEASAPFPSRLNRLLKAAGSRLPFWDTLALLADQPSNRYWVCGIRCPSCGSAKISSWHGGRCGEAEVSDATFIQAAALSDHEICERLKVTLA